MNIINRFNEWLNGNSALLVFSRIIENFAIYAIPGFLMVWVLSKKPIYLLMYVLLWVCMLLAVSINTLLCYQFMRIMRDWKKYLAVNLGSYLFFAAATIAWYYAIALGEPTSSDTLFYTKMFAGLRAFECFGVKTIVSVIITHIVSVIVYIVTGRIAWVHAKRDEEEMMQIINEGLAEDML